MSFIAGIDYDSSAIHVVLIDENTGIYCHRTVFALDRDGQAFDRARQVRDALPYRQEWLDEGIVAVGIEEPFTRQLNSLVALIRVQGAILSCLPRELLVEPLRPQRWKLLALGAGNGNAGKGAVANFAVAHGMPADLDQDFFDAFAIARAVHAVLERSVAA